MASRAVRGNPVTVGDVLDGHVNLDLECLDRIYLHGYLGQLQVGGQVIRFLQHRGFPIPSPACLQQIGDAFRRSSTVGGRPARFGLDLAACRRVIRSRCQRKIVSGRTSSCS